MSEAAVDPFLENYSESVARRLQRFKAEEAAFLKSWLLQYPIGSNYALQILEQLEDLLKKEARDLQKIFNEQFLSLDVSHLQPKELGKRLRDLFEKKLHPHSQSHEEAFRHFVKQLDLSPGVELIPPQNFEGRFFNLKISFDSSEALQQALESLKENLKTKDWSKLKDF